MDMLGDAEPVDLGDDAWSDEEYVDVERPPSASLMTPEAWAVTSLTLSVASLLFVSIAQFQSFFLTGTFGFDGQGDDRTKEYLFLLGPSGVMALLGAFAGWQVWRRRSAVAPWTGGLATAGLLLGGLIALVVAAGLVIMQFSDPPAVS